MTRIKYLMITVLPALLISGGIAAGQKIENSKGIRSVHNESDGTWGTSPKVSLEFVRNIGELDSADENLLFHMPADIAFDEDSNVYVLDSGNYRIQKFDSEGRYLATLGRKGEGPGEFQMPLSLDIDNGVLYVSDAANQRLQKLHLDGRDAGAVSMQQGAGSTIRLLSDGRMLSGGGFGILGMGPGGLEQPKKPPKPLKVLDAEGLQQGELGDPFDYEDPLLNSMGNRFHFAVDQDGCILIAFDVQNRIDKYAPDGTLLWRSDRKLDYSTKPPKKKGEMKRSGGAMMIQMPEMNRVSGGVALDGSGRIWVINYRRQLRDDEKVGMNVNVNRDSSGKRSMALSAQGNTDIRNTDAFRLEVYDGEGVLLGTFPLGHFADDIRIQDNRIYILDRLRGAQFYEYRIVE